MARKRSYTSQQEQEYNTRMAQSFGGGNQHRKERNFLIDIVILIVLFFVAYLILEPLLNKAADEDLKHVTNENGEYVAVDYPIISEVMSSNKSAYPSSDGEYYDWVEIFNPTPRSINLDGYGLTDKAEDPAAYVFPSIVLEPGQFAVVFLSGGAVEDSMHANFKLSSSGETLFLFDSQQNLLEKVFIDHLPPNVSYARNLAILNDWTQNEYYTPGFYNDEVGWDTYLQTRRAYDSPIMINEVMASNLITIADCDGDYSDWVEIINTSDQQMVLTGYALSDSVQEPRKWIFPYTVLEPGQLMVVYLSGKDKLDEDTQQMHTDFKLNSIEDNIILANKEGKIIDHWLIQNLGDDKSMQRKKGSLENVQISSHPTPGYENTEDMYNVFRKEYSVHNTSGLIISEVMIGNTNTLEDNFSETPDWIELYNPTSERIELENLFLSDDPNNLKQWRFPEDFFIGPDAYLVVYASGREQSGGSGLHTNFSISSEGEPVILSDIDGNIMDTCVLAPMPYDVSYGRAGQDMTFQYMPYATPGEANGLGWSGFTPDPLFHQQGGMYVEGSVIAIDVPEGAEVYYTIDCTEPTENSQLYQGPFQIYETTVLKARAYEDGKLASNVKVATYFVGIEHELPVVSITSDPMYLFSDHAGIYAYGTNYDKKHMPIEGANFNQDWEVPAYLEMYEIDGSEAISQGIGLRIFGAFSRAELKKSFALVARSQYGSSVIDYPIFPSLPYKEYKSVVLRTGASEWYSSMIRDSLLTSLAADTTDLDVQAYYPAVVYLNGEYWGVYFFRQKINKYYLEQKYGMDPDNVDIIYGNGTSARHARAGTNENWLELREYVKTHDLSDPQVYEKVKSWVDIESYMDMVINEIYVGNQDTGNIKCYRERTEGAKWKWFYYDVDWGFFYTLAANVNTNNLRGYINDVGHGAGDGFETWLIMGLLENKDFERQFIERFAYHINVTYNSDRVIERINEIYELLDPEMPQDRAHWDQVCESSPDWYKAIASRGMSYESWSSTQKERLINFANQRPAVMQSQLVAFFDISPEWESQLFS
ncbi:MAG: lamin tail domain-containing protein [Eubacteriales bacterium]